MYNKVSAEDKLTETFPGQESLTHCPPTTGTFRQSRAARQARTEQGEREVRDVLIAF